MSNKSINLIGWILFIISAIGFIISSVVTSLPEGVLGWIRKDGPRKLLFLIGINKKLETYPSLEVNEQGEVKS